MCMPLALKILKVIRVNISQLICMTHCKHVLMEINYETVTPAPTLN